MIVAYAPNEPQSIPTLADALQGQTVEYLKKIAALVSDEKNKPIRKADLVEFVLRHVNGERYRLRQFEDDPLQGFWRKLDVLQQAAVAETVHGPHPWFDGERFAAKYGQAPNWGEGRYYNSNPSLLGVFFYDRIMPDDLRRRFKSFVPKPEPVRLSPQHELPAEWALTYQEWDEQTRKSKAYRQMVPIAQRLTERAAIHDIKAILRLIDAGKLAVSDKTHQPGVAALRSLDALLLGGDYYDDSEYGEYEKIGPIKPFAWPMLVQAGGLASLSGKTLQLTKTGQKALSEPVEKTLAQLWQRWLKTTLFDELRRIDCIKGQTGKGKRGLTAVAGRRAAIDRALRGCPPGQWIAVHDLFRQMRATDAGFEVTRDPWNLYVCEPGYGNLGENHHGWNILQARYALCLLFEYAATLGLLDVAYIPPHDARPDYSGIWGTDDLPFFSRYDGLLYLRVNPLGACVLGLADRYQPAAPEVAATPLLRVLPNLEIAAIGPRLEPADAMLLDSYAEKVSDAVWKLEQGRLLEALEAGHDIAVLAELLVSLGGQPLPETVERFLEDMARRARSLKATGTARLIECADAVLATLIANDSRTKPYCLLAGDRWLAVPVESEARFRSALRKLGYGLPK
ncbi:MAG: helicase-associated domain-containing protein [Candidatus Competibacter sp.]|nr:helicase-associated domain-containing protein [Candidatus Competibacter sp.]